MYFCLDNDLLPQITNMGRNITNSDWKHFQRLGTDYVMFLVNDGCMYIKENDFEYVLERGDMLLLEPNKNHWGFKENFCDYYYIHFRPSCFSVFDCSELNSIVSIITENRSEFYKCSSFGDELYKKTKLFIPKDIKINKASTFNELTTKADEALASVFKKSQHCKLICSSKFIEILTILSDYFTSEKLKLTDEAIAKSSRRVEAVIELINTHYPEKISGDFISSKLNLNFDYLNRIFKKQLGMTIFEYLSSTRIDRAKELLLRGNMKAYEIATAVGFSDEYSFSKVFKKAVGITPKKFTKM